MLSLLSTNPLLTSLSLTLLHFLWQGLLVAAVLKSALLIFNDHKPQLRYALSTLAMSVNLLLPIITFTIVYQTENSSYNAIVNSFALSEFIQELKHPDAFFSYKELTTLLPALLPYIAIFWLAIISLLAAKLLIEIYSINLLPQQSIEPPSQRLQARFIELVEEIQLARTPRLLISLKASVPMAIGWLKPVVLLPASMVSGLSTPQLEMLLLHELAHIRRHDYLVNFFQTLVEILLFFHPAVHWVSKQMRNEREYCSDDIAVQHCGDAIAYAHTLADTASLCATAHHHTIPDLAMAASGGDLKQRVTRLVDHHCAPKNNISKWFAGVTIIFSVLLLSSKQLLTMPLFDISYNEKPWQKPNNTTSAQTNSANSNNKLATSSIAQQLLAPQVEQSNIATTTDLKTPIASPDTLSKKLAAAGQIHTTVKEEPLTMATPQQALASNVTPATTLLDVLALTSQSSYLIDQLSTAETSTVEKAFEGPNYKSKSLLAKPKQQEIATLSTSPAVKIPQAKQVNSENKNQHTTLLADSANVNDKKKHLSYLDQPYIEKKTNIKTKFVAHVARPKEEWLQPIVITNKLITPITPVWHSAEQLKSVTPIYPSVAKRKGIEIDVKVNFTIDIDGQIKNIKFAQHNKVNYFKSSIRSAIKKWRFLPAKVDEKPVESQMAKVFSFSLQS